MMMFKEFHSQFSLHERRLQWTDGSWIHPRLMNTTTMTPCGCISQRKWVFNLISLCNKIALAWVKRDIIFVRLPVIVRCYDWGLGNNFLCGEWYGFILRIINIRNNYKINKKIRWLTAVSEVTLWTRRYKQFRISSSYSSLVVFCLPICVISRFH